MKPAASEQDLVTCPEHIGPVGRLVALGKPDVFINGRSAIRLGDTAICSVGGPDAIGQGAATVRVGGLPAAGLADMSFHPSRIDTGSEDVNLGGPVFALPRNVTLGGGQDFRNKTIRDLWLVSQTPTGREIFDRMQRAGKPLTIEPGSENLTTPDGRTIFYNPDLKLIVTDEDSNPISAPPQVALGHELVHHVRIAEGTTAKEQLDEERRVRGDKSHVEDDTINENRLRDDLGLTRRDGPEMPTPESVRGAVDGPMDLRPGGY